MFGKKYHLEMEIAILRKCDHKLKEQVKSFDEHVSIHDNAFNSMLKDLKKEVAFLLKYYSKEPERYAVQIAILVKIESAIQNVIYSKEQLISLSGWMTDLIDNIQILLDQSTAENVSTRRSFLKKVAKSGAFVAAGGVSLLAISKYIIDTAKDLPVKENDGLAILISTPRNIFERFGSNFVDIYIARIELAFGFKPKPENIIFNATTKDLDRTLKDPDVQNISILGHGDWSSWATGRGAECKAWDLFKMFKEIRMRKKGFLLKHTCGNIEKTADMILTDKALKIVQDKMHEINLKLKNKYIISAQEPDIRFGQGFIINNQIGGKIDSSVFSLPVDFFTFIETTQAIQEIKEFFFTVKLMLEDKKYTQPCLFGYPFFQFDKIAAWSRITSPIDFILDPFAGKKYDFDRSDETMQFYANNLR